jgi:hypothetical protein
MLLLVLPIIPIQPLFVVVGSALSVIALLLVGLGGSRWSAHDALARGGGVTPNWPDAA